MKRPNKLPVPIKDAIDIEVDEQTIQRLWREVSSESPKRALWPKLAFAAIAAVALIVWALPSRDVLLTVDGRALADFVVAPNEPARVVRFSDRSSLAMQPGTLIETLQNDRSIVALHVKQGRSNFVVQAGGTRRWIIECGLATVEVVGTDFTIERSEERLRVSVQSGVVLVRGERVPDRVRQLIGGEEIEILAEIQAAIPSPPPTPSQSQSPSPSPSPSQSPSLSPSPVRPPSPLPTASTSPTPIRSVRIDDLLLEADEARRGGDPRAAVEILERVIAENRGDTLSALAAFTLGRIELFELGRHERARAAFAQALRWPLPLDLQEDALAHLVHATKRSGDSAAARQLAEQYLREHPGGRHARAIERIVSEKPE